MTAVAVQVNLCTQEPIKPHRALECLALRRIFPFLSKILLHLSMFKCLGVVISKGSTLLLFLKIQAIKSENVAFADLV